MNVNGRKELEKADALLEQALEIISAIKDEEQEKYDNMPESFQNGEKGGRLQEGIDALQEAEDEITSAKDNLERAANQ